MCEAPPPWIVGLLGWGGESTLSPTVGCWPVRGSPDALPGESLQMNPPQGGRVCSAWEVRVWGRTFLAEGTACVPREGRGIAERPGACPEIHRRPGREGGQEAALGAEHSLMARLGGSLRPSPQTNDVPLCISKAHALNRMEMVVRLQVPLGVAKVRPPQPWERGGIEGEQEIVGGSRGGGRVETG